MKIIKIVGSIIVIFGLFVATLPMLLSTTWGNQFLLDLFNSPVYKAQAFQLSWFGPQQVWDATFVNRQAIGKCDHVTIHSGLVDLLSNGWEKNSYEVQKLSISFEMVTISHVSGLINLNLPYGHILLDLKGPNEKIKLDGQVKNGILTLNQPFEMEVPLTPKLSEVVFKEMLPLLSGAISSEKPINVLISPKGFSFNMRKPLSPRNILIGDAVVQLEKIHFSNSGEIENILKILKKSHEDHLTVWFTPLYLSMSYGKLYLKRCDMLLNNSYPIAAWGSVDFIHDKVDMIIGLSGTALRRALNITNLDNSYMLQLPLRGSINSPTIDTSKATTKLGALIAKNKGGAQGLILGTILDVAGGSLTEETPPPPTTKPLPWEVGSQ